MCGERGWGAICSDHGTKVTILVHNRTCGHDTVVDILCILSAPCHVEAKYCWCMAATFSCEASLDTFSSVLDFRLNGEFVTLYVCFPELPSQSCLDFACSDTRRQNRRFSGLHERGLPLVNSC